jgi:aryl-alcohol dehydrogenase-like predicted oxidoreductase
VLRELGATSNQVVLAWMLASRPGIIPIAGASSVEQPDELLAATDLELDEPARLASTKPAAVSIPWSTQRARP